MTIWKSKDELPIQVDAIYILCCFYGEEEPSYNLMSALSYKDIGYYCVKWCYLGDLLALEQQNESLYQNQMSIIETNNVLIKRLKEAEEVIEWYANCNHIVSGAYNAKTHTLDTVEALNVANPLSYGIEQGQKAQAYLIKYKEKDNGN